MRIASSGAVLTSLAAFLTACHPEFDPVLATPTTLQILSGNGQAGVPGYRLADTVRVLVLDGFGNPISGARVRFAADGYGLPEPDIWTTGLDGIARTNWRLGETLGEQRLRVTVDESNIGSTSVTATASTQSVLSISSSSYLVCAVTLDGILGCWRAPGIGLPDGPATRFAPVPTERFTQVEVAGRKELGAGTVCALTVSGRVRCSTFTTTGSLPSGAPVALTEFTELAGSYPALISFASTGSTVTTKGLSYCGLTASGEAWCWGSNLAGQLGDGTLVAHSAPAPVSTTARFAQLSVGDGTACGVTAGGEAWCWGLNANGQVGNGAVGSPVLTPTAVVTPLRFSKVFVASLGDFTSCGVGIQGGLYCWGNLPGVTVRAAMQKSVTTPTQLPGWDQVQHIGEVNSATLGWRRNGKVLFWGDMFPIGADAAYAGLLDLRIAPLLTDIQISHSVVFTCGRAGYGEGTLCIYGGAFLYYPYQEREIGFFSDGTPPYFFGVPFP